MWESLGPIALLSVHGLALDDAPKLYAFVEGQGCFAQSADLARPCASPLIARLLINLQQLLMVDGALAL